MKKYNWPIKQFHIFDLSLEWIQWHIIIPQRSLWLLRDIFLWINRRQTPMIGVYLLLDLFPVQCFSLNRTTHAQCGTHGCQDCRCKVPQKLNKPRFVLLSHTFVLHYFNCSTFLYPHISTDEKIRLDYHRFHFLWLFLSTDYHRFPQIF